MTVLLYYVHDPMCSWCYAFEAVKQELLRDLSPRLTVRRLLGGLAQDSDEPMPAELRERIQQTWSRIGIEVPGVRFNHEFWSRCAPRRSTYPACRAVIAARRQGEPYDEAMTRAIQRAYYTEARNPSDVSTLVELAGELGLDAPRFERDLADASLQAELIAEIALSRQLHADSMPSLVLQTGVRSSWPIAIDYHDAGPMLETINSLLAP